MEESHSQLQLLAGDSRDTRIISKIRDFLLSQASGINPSVIERQIQELFPTFQTPTHLPYAWMIQKAVRVLNERNGSTKEAISEFMKNEFQDLPWAHSSILDLHLGKLCQAGELLHTVSGRYMLMEDYNKLDKMRETPRRGGRRIKKYNKGRNHRGREAPGRSEGAERFNEFHEQKNEEQNHLSELNGTGTYEPIEEQGKSEKSGVTEVDHGQVVPGEGEVEIEAITEISRFCADEISNNNNENLSYSLGGPTVSVIPNKKLRIPEQEEHHQSETPFVQQKFSDVGLVDQEGPVFHTETTCSSLFTVPDLPIDLTFDSQNCSSLHTPSEGRELTRSQLLVQTSKCGTLEAELYEAFEMPASMTFNGHKQAQDDILGSPKRRVEERATFADLEKHKPIPQCIERQPIEKSFSDNQEESLLPSDGSIVDKQKPKYYKMKQQLQLRPGGQGRGRRCWRSLELDRNPHKYKEKLQFQDQTLTLVSLPSLDPNETIHSLPPPNLPASPNLQQLIDPTSEESPSCITRGISQLQLFLQMSWDRLVWRDLGTTSKTDDSLSSMNCLEHKQQQQHGNKRGLKRKLNSDGKTESGHVEQQSPKRRRRGRPPKPVPTQDYQWSWVAVEHRVLQPSGNIEGHCETWAQDQAQVQVHFPNLADDNYPSGKQTRRRRPRLKFDSNGICRKHMVLSSQG